MRHSFSSSMNCKVMSLMSLRHWKNYLVVHWILLVLLTYLLTSLIFLMKYWCPWDNNQKPFPNRFQTNPQQTTYQAPQQNNPQPYLKPTENPLSYWPNFPNQSLETHNHSTSSSVKPKLIFHKNSLRNHYAWDFQAEELPEPKVKDFAYYARRAQELAESGKAFVATVSRNVDRYWSYGDNMDEGRKRNFCLMSRLNFKCDFGYWSSGSDDGDDEGKTELLLHNLKQSSWPKHHPTCTRHDLFKQFWYVILWTFSN